MKGPFTVSMVAVVLIVTAGVATAAEFGTREQGKTLLDRPVAVLRANMIFSKAEAPSVVSAEFRSETQPATGRCPTPPQPC